LANEKVRNKDTNIYYSWGSGGIKLLISSYVSSGGEEAALVMSRVSWWHLYIMAGLPTLMWDTHIQSPPHTHVHQISHTQLNFWPCSPQVRPLFTACIVQEYHTHMKKTTQCGRAQSFEKQKLKDRCYCGVQ